jgi:hypothetical protein
MKHTFSVRFVLLCALKCILILLTIVLYYPRTADSRNAGHLFLWLLVAPVAIGVARGRRGPTGVSFFFFVLMVVVEKRLGHSNHPAPAYCTLIRFGNSHLETRRSILYYVQRV